MCFCTSLLFGFPGLFFFSNIDLLWGEVLSFPKGCVYWCMALDCHALEVKAVKWNITAKTKYEMYFCDFLAYHCVPCSEQCHRLSGKSQICWVHVATIEHSASTSLQWPGHLPPALTDSPSWFPNIWNDLQNVFRTESHPILQQELKPYLCRGECQYQSVYLCLHLDNISPTHFTVCPVGH